MNRSLMRHVKLVVFLTGRGISCLQSVVQFKDPQLKGLLLRDFSEKNEMGHCPLIFPEK